MENEIKTTFKKNPGFLENPTGLARLDMLSPINKPFEIPLITNWESEKESDY
jgi:hypothetical protein